jgi:drug/metabolite transporter (DMT)-like permease
MVAAEWLRPGGSAPDRRVAAGIGVGLAGVALLPMGGGPGGVDPLGLGVLLVSAMAWVAASACFRGEWRPASQAYAAGMPLLTGGALLFLASLVTGETARVEAADVTPAAVAALAYLVVFGSVIAFTAYTWLVQVETPARAGSYAYVNPLVALTLGWAIAGEALTPRMLLAAGTIVGSVFLVVSGHATPRQPSRKPLRPWVARPAWRVPRNASPGHRAARGGRA